MPEGGRRPTCKGKAKGKGGKGKDGKGKTGKTFDAANIEADANEGAIMIGEEETWWLGAQYCLTRELPVSAAPASLLTARFSNSSAVRPVRLSNSFAVLADLDDVEAWPLPAVSSKCTTQTGDQPIPLLRQNLGYSDHQRLTLWTVNTPERQRSG